MAGLRAPLTKYTSPAHLLFYLDMMHDSSSCISRTYSRKILERSDDKEHP